MKTLIHPTYLPSIAHFIATIKAQEVVFEMDDNFVKQTYRNRASIYAANGKLNLNIPVTHSQKERQKYRDVKIANDTKWQSQHWKSLLSAYKTSPFFEFYEDELQPLFNQKTDFLLEHNLKCFEVICDCLQLNLNISYSEKFEKEPQLIEDYRHFVNAKSKTKLNLKNYTQVFINKHGFIENLSILDLLFNEGPNTLNYLENQNLE